MKKYFVTGLITLAPIILTIIIIGYLVNFFTAPFVDLLQNLFSDYAIEHGINLKIYKPLIRIACQILIIFATVALIYLLGFLASKFFFKTIFNLTNKLLARIPIVRSIYNLTKDMFDMVFSKDKKTFQKTVLVPFPHKDSQAIGFITAEAPDKLKEIIPELKHTIFVPTSPHPISGFLLLTPEEQAKQVNLKVDEAFKLLISCGIVSPDNHKKDSKDPPKTNTNKEKS